MKATHLLHQNQVLIGMPDVSTHWNSTCIMNECLGEQKKFWDKVASGTAIFPVGETTQQQGVIDSLPESRDPLSVQEDHPCGINTSKCVAM